MNNLLRLKARFYQSSRPATGGPRSLPSGDEAKVTYEHINKLVDELDYLIDYWKDNNDVISKVLVNVHYIKLIPKSSRLKSLFKEPGSEPDKAIVGAKFETIETKYGKEQAHVMTYCLNYDTLITYKNILIQCSDFIESNLAGVFDNSSITSLRDRNIKYVTNDISLSKFSDLMVDFYYVDSLDVNENPPEFGESCLVTIYDAGVNARELLKKLNIDSFHSNIIDNNTFLLEKNQYDILKDKAPYLIAMSNKDMNDFYYDDGVVEEAPEIFIPEPKNEPVIVVIDTLFDTNVYFSKWVQYIEKVDEEIPKDYKSYFHGTEVTSIIVDGPSFNSNLDDGCGRFQVRHFGVAAGNKFSSFTLLKKIRNIVTSNLDIKVWNLSLGSTLEIDNNFISPIAALLDELQYKYDVIFVVAGTNKKSDGTPEKIGAPADSINSVVVNSVNSKNEPASYSRKGPVLSFFTKPDVCYYGGDNFEEINVISPNGKLRKSGTSFAAPWIARKLAYMIQVLGIPREVAKALLIDSAAGWNKKEQESNIIGYGVIPQKITDIVNTKDDEIRFFLYDKSLKYNTYNYRIPVPKTKNTYPYIAKATLCYFPKCNRNQGVDYTCTEFDFHFGRIKNDKGEFNTINDNRQNEESQCFTKEGEARKFFRKWDNVKFIGEFDNNRKGNKKVYEGKNWGIKILTTERLSEKNGENLPFGVVITLKDLEGKNRIDQFIQECESNEIFVTPITIENTVDVYNKAQEDIHFE